MRIVNKDEFYSLPDGTVYAEYDPIVFEGLYIKLKTLKDINNNPIDYYYIHLLGNIDAQSSSDEADIMIEAEETGKSFKLDFECVSKDGMYESEGLFAIYEKEDIEKFINSLQTCLKKLR